MSEKLPRFRFPFVAGAALAGLAAFTSEARADKLIWIEAEQAHATNIRNEGAYVPASPAQIAALSGGSWLTAKVAPGQFAEYDVTVTEGGRHTFYARRFWLHGAFRWRFDDGPWVSQDKEKQTVIDAVKTPDGHPATWVDLGYVDLAPGRHVLRIEVLADSAYKFNRVFAFDCFALSSERFRPKGLGGLVEAPAAPLVSQENLGRHLPRTFALLTSATPEQRTPVNILLYGQSIIANGGVTDAITRHLRAAYPNARITIANTSIGGYQAERLHLTAWQDLYPVYPDLVVFHVYGGETTGELEEIFRNIRRYTTAEMLTWTHHVDNFGTGIDTARDVSAETNRRLARKYGFEIAEVREQWKEHLKTTHTHAGDYLADQIHMNARGVKLLGDYLTPHLRPNPLASDAWKKRVRTLDLRQPQPDITHAPGAWRATPDGLVSTGTQPLRIAFTGNRVQFIGAQTPDAPGALRVLIDGKPASAHPGAYAVSRSAKAPGAWWPAVSRVTLGPDPVEDTYTLSFTNVSPDGSGYDFTLTGARTGDEGAGASGRDFVSRSGRIRIAATDLDIAGVKRVTQKDIPPTFEADFKVYGLGRDLWRPPVGARPEIIVHDTVFQELETRPHVLEIIPDGRGPVTLRGIILHNPLADSLLSD